MAQAVHTRIVGPNKMEWKGTANLVPFMMKKAAIFAETHEMEVVDLKLNFDWDGASLIAEFVAEPYRSEGA